MKIIVSGASGFVGRKLVEGLCTQNHEVIALVRSEKDHNIFQSSSVHVYTCPMSDYDKPKIQEILSGSDLFYHLAWDGTSGAGRSDLEKQLDNVRYTKSAVHLACRSGCRRFVFAGSIMEYEAAAYIPRQGAEPKMESIYSIAKLAGDYCAKVISQNLGMEYVNLVLSNIYGPGEESARFLNRLVYKMRHTEEIELTEGKQLYDFIYITDAVEAMILAGCRGQSGGVYYIGNRRQRPLREYIEAASRVIGSRSVLKYGAVQFQGPYLTYQEVDTGRVSREFGFDPKVDFEKGIALLLEKNA